MGPIALSFGLGSAVVLVISALFSTRHNQIVSGFLLLMWAATKVWNSPFGSDAQLYLDVALACLCGLLCVVAMHKERRSVWPVLILGVMATWIMISALYAEIRDLTPQVKFSCQLAANVLFGIALFVAATPGGLNGSRVLRRWLSLHPRRRFSVHHSYRSAQEKAERRRLKAR